MIRCVLLAGLATAATAGVEDRGFGLPMEIPVADVLSWDGLGSPNNESVIYQPPFPVDAFTIAWDLTLTTFGGSWASEATIAVFVDDDFRFTLTPGIGQNHGVSGERYRSQGEVSLVDLGLDFFVFDTIRLEFFESFDDVLGEPDALWNGTVWFNDVPGSGTPLVLAMALIVTHRRRPASRQARGRRFPPV